MNIIMLLVKDALLRVPSLIRHIIISLILKVDFAY
jgi:hypothetical protein